VGHAAETATTLTNATPVNTNVVNSAPPGFSLETAGARFGLPGNGSSHHFKSVEAALNLNLPWSLNLGAGWRAQTRLDCSAGWLADDVFDAAKITLGPTVLIPWPDSRVSFEIGASPTYISRYVFERLDFGMNFQITSHGGVNFDFSKRLRGTFRYEHMSNAGLSSNNPGLNLFALGLDYRF
jgi:hypothetical protein